MKNVGIQKACSEDWSKMTPTEKGAFCQKCVKHVHDFTNKSTDEIKRTLLKFKGQEVCGRMTIDQEIALNAEFDDLMRSNKTNFQHLFIMALMIVFGLTLFSCEDERDQQKIVATQAAITKIIEQKDIVEEITIPNVDNIFVREIDVESISFSQDSFVEVIDEVEIVGYPETHISHILGGIGSSPIYLEYLEPLTREVELDENGDPIPTEFKAFAFPNPAVESTTIEIQAPQKEHMDIQLYDTSGKRIKEIYSGKISKGTFRQLIDLTDLTSGIYLIIIQSKDFKETVRILKN
ncbi:T9SS type A sorting domain-containing protein [Fluviicola taffensis]|uniref:Secretion system C-terminal sorting domain-containing protein n=1 Tax=Fluviicola taffensis (strain DSM 16823 / NCIMB 13979 / RW262) TaxID=755732 RepID=F2IJC4_FLUTR|nr:T9SS type A sorting domain-containing protein [Fluviicola taffensis]AEA46021.1 hypothetical protein Fluta_4059 [Fluviicola taffensis DSM 16823]